MKHVIIIGAGSYVLEDSFGDGVILPSLLEISKDNDISSITICVRSKRSSEFWNKVKALKNKLGVDIPINEYIITEVNDLHKVIFKSTVAFIATPDKNHYEYAEFLIENKIPTYIVKPLTGNGTLSKSLVEKAEEHNVPLWVDYHKRFDMSNRKLKQIINSRKYGRLNMYSVQYSQPNTMPLFNISSWANDVDVFQYIGCHYVDQIFYLFPDVVPLRISATGIGNYLNNNSGPKYDIVNVLIDFKLNDNHTFRADFNVSWSDPTGSSSKSHQRVEAQFENGRIIADQKERGFEVWDSVKTNEINPYFFQIVESNDSEYYTVSGYGFDSIKKFLDNIDNPVRNTDLPWGYNTYKTDVVIDASKKSLALNGGWVKIN
jgi:predicted dehydrogenase